MPDRSLSWTASGPGRLVAARLGLPRPEPLRCRQDGGPDAPGPVLVGATEGGRLAKTVRALLADWAVAAPDATTPADAADAAGALAALVLDATGITGSERLRELYAFLHPRVRSLAPCGRVVLLGTPPELAADSGEAAAQRQALLGA
ncbi:hypothetical protein [Streptacidiphilus anmyonensis]|uniref:hypothetical protein n=1 Tax=Streptacidiphilus anmyonensis TaxID=405782 RepID=UPI0005A89C56|nr:hypothetical protein [Streptacidiphilus anmyonensis]